MGMEFKSGRQSNIFIIAGMEIYIWTITTCLFSFFPLQELMHYSSYRYGRDREVLSNFLRSLRDTMSKKLLCVSCERCGSFLEWINKRTKGWSSADGDAEEVNNPASEWCCSFIDAFSRFTLEISLSKTAYCYRTHEESGPGSSCCRKGECSRNEEGKRMGKGH